MGAALNQLLKQHPFLSELVRGPLRHQFALIQDLLRQLLDHLEDSEEYTQISLAS